MIKYNENNEVFVIGEVESELKFNHEIYGESFYNFIVKIPRLSESCDYINVMISDRLLLDMPIRAGDMVEIDGQFRSYNNYNSGGSRLVLTIFVKEIAIHDESKNKNPNQIYLNGYICKEPVYRTTPFGREISDILIAVNRTYNKSDYIPAIAWGRNARYTKDLKVGQNIKIWGRIQSREYQKNIDNIVLTKTAYEVSINKLEALNEDDVDIVNE